MQGGLGEELRTVHADAVVVLVSVNDAFTVGAGEIVQSNFFVKKLLAALDK